MLKDDKLGRKIAIIGAGPAGLSAAEALREKGYTDITVFEKSSRVGGQSLSCEYLAPDGHSIVYEMGSLQPLSSKILLRLLKEHGLSFGRGPLQSRAKVVIAHSYKRNEEFLNFSKYYFGVPLRNLPALLSDVAKLSPYIWRYRRLRKPGYYDFKYWNETTESFRDWVRARQFKVIGDKLTALFFNLMTLSNKNHEDHVRVYAVFKLLYLMLQSPMRYIDGTYRPVKEGYQQLWTRVAKRFNVVLRANIQRITRDDEGVTITTPDQTYHFDRLIISCPFDKIAPVLDTRGAERETFANISYNPGYRGAFIARNAPIEGLYWYPDSYDTGDQPPYLAVAVPEGKVSDDSYLYSCVFSHCPNRSDAVKILQTSAAEAFREQYGAEITSWVNMKYWDDYGARFNMEAIHNRVFDKAQSMQGSFHTYYAGQVLTFGTHSAVVDYSYQLVDLFF